jgi:uncharacterized cupin superfamily protein
LGEREFTILHRDQFERTGDWLLARRSLGLEAFGLNLVDIQPGESIPEHDEQERDQEEVFIVLRGSPTIVIEGEHHLVPAGTFVRLEPQLRRTIVNQGAGVASVLIASAPRSSGYKPMGWA